MEALAELLIAVLGRIRMSKTQLIAVITAGWIAILLLWAAGVLAQH